MEPAVIVTLAAAAVVVVVVLVAAFASLHLAARRGQRRLEAELVASRAELAALRDRVDAVARPSSNAAPARATDPDYLITRLGEPDASLTDGDATLVAGRDFASVALGESLVRVVSLAYGVGRALSPASRDRIRLEMHREVRRSRRQRRLDLKEARRHLRAQPRAGLDEDAA